MDWEKMNIEELRDEIIKKTKELEKAQEVNKIFEESLKAKDSEINSYLNDIKELKLKNYDLFIQIPKVTEQKKLNDEEEETISLNDITNNLIERMDE